MHWIGKLGFVILTAGTLVSYVIFAVVRINNYGMPGPLPVITDMFREWPLAASLTAGLGSTMLMYGVLVTENGNKVWLLMSTSSLWVVVGSSNTFGQPVLSWLHDVVTLFFLACTIMALKELEGMLFTSTQLVCMVAALSAITCGLLLNIDKNTNGARVALGASELLFLTSLGLGYGYSLFFKTSAAATIVTTKKPTNMFKWFRMSELRSV